MCIYMYMYSMEFWKVLLFSGREEMQKREKREKRELLLSSCERDNWNQEI